MNWNYRLVKWGVPDQNSKTDPPDATIYYGLSEVYYEGNGEVMGYTPPEDISEDYAEVKEGLEMKLADLERSPTPMWIDNPGNPFSFEGELLDNVEKVVDEAIKDLEYIKRLNENCEGDSAASSAAHAYTVSLNKLNKIKETLG